jgi:hypothetical protein
MAGGTVKMVPPAMTFLTYAFQVPHVSIKEPYFEFTCISAAKYFCPGVIMAHPEP